MAKPILTIFRHRSFRWFYEQLFKCSFVLFHPVLPLDGKKKLREGLQRERAAGGGCQEFFKNSRAFAQTSLVNFRENGREQFEAEAAATAPPVGESGTRLRDCVGTSSAWRRRAPHTRKTSNFTFFPLSSLRTSSTFSRRTVL